MPPQTSLQPYKLPYNLPTIPQTPTINENLFSVYNLKKIKNFQSIPLKTNESNIYLLKSNEGKSKHNYLHGDILTPESENQPIGLLFLPSFKLVGLNRTHPNTTQHHPNTTRPNKPTRTTPQHSNAYTKTSLSLWQVYELGIRYSIGKMLKKKNPIMLWFKKLFYIFAVLSS